MEVAQKPTLIKGKNGGEFTVGDCGSVWLPPFPCKIPYTEQLTMIKNIKIRDDDVILTGFPKCGSNWFYEILHMLTSGKAEYEKSCKTNQMVDMLSAEEIEALPTPRVLNSHLLFKYMPAEAIKKKTKMVLLQRNPKDICVSFYHHMSGWINGGYSGSWDSYFDIFLDTGFWYGTYWDMILDWEKVREDNPDYPIHEVFYEDALKDPVGTVCELSKFLGFDRSKELCVEIANKCSFQNLKKATGTAKEDPYKNGFWRENSAGFFRKGKNGDWRNQFTVAQNERFDDILNDRMKDSKTVKHYRRSNDL